MAKSSSIGTNWGGHLVSVDAAVPGDPRFLQAFVERLGLPEHWEVYGPPGGCTLEGGKIACH